MSPIRILVVEDESIVALDIRYRLSKLGYEVVSLVETGEEAVSLVPEVAPDLILMDIMLAGEMDGIQAAGIITERWDVPIVYLTAYADEETLNRVKRTQSFGYIIKPFDDREIHTAIEMAHYKHNSEKRRREDRQWLQTTLNSVGEGVISSNAEGMVSYCNRKAVCITGRKKEAIKGQCMRDALWLVDSEGRSVDLIRNVVQTGKTYHSDALFMHIADGSTIPVELTASPIQDDDKIPRGFVIAFRNISGRKETVRQLKTTVAKLRQAVDATVQALVVTSEKRDPYTAGHQQRVAQLAVAIARKLGFSEDRVDFIRVAGLLHDLGKIYIPAEILSKPAKLTNMEFGLMQSHPEVGFEILRAVPFPWPVADIVLQHHERLDGTGYPAGLKEDGVSQEARIIAVADVVEAMSSHRPYRAALGRDRALEEIVSGKGIRYDSVVVDACLELFASSGFEFE